VVLGLSLCLALGLLLASPALYRLLTPGKTPAERHTEELNRRYSELQQRRNRVSQALNDQFRSERGEDPLLREELEQVDWAIEELSKERAVVALEAACERETWQQRLRRAIGW
jgi:hypothetical protein